MVRHKGSARKLGDLEQEVAKHRALPGDPAKGFFVVSAIGKDSKGKPHVTLLATTRKLMQRWAAAPACTVHADVFHRLQRLLELCHGKRRPEPFLAGCKTLQNFADWKSH